VGAAGFEPATVSLEGSGWVGIEGVKRLCERRLWGCERRRSDPGWVAAGSRCGLRPASGRCGSPSQLPPHQRVSVTRVPRRSVVASRGRPRPPGSSSSAACGVRLEDVWGCGEARSARSVRSGGARVSSAQATSFPTLGRDPPSRVRELCATCYILTAGSSVPLRPVGGRLLHAASAVL